MSFWINVGDLSVFPISGYRVLYAVVGVVLFFASVAIFAHPCTIPIQDIMETDRWGYCNWSRGATPCF